MTKPKFYPFMQFEENFTENFPDDFHVKYINHQNGEYNKMMTAFGKYAVSKGVLYPFAHSLMPDAKPLYEEWKKNYTEYVEIPIDHFAD